MLTAAVEKVQNGLYQQVLQLASQALKKTPSDKHAQVQRAGYAVFYAARRWRGGGYHARATCSYTGVGSEFVIGLRLSRLSRLSASAVLVKLMRFSQRFQATILMSTPSL